MYNKRLSFSYTNLTHIARVQFATELLISLFTSTAADKCTYNAEKNSALK